MLMIKKLIQNPPVVLSTVFSAGVLTASAGMAIRQMSKKPEQMADAVLRERTNGPYLTDARKAARAKAKIIERQMRDTAISRKNRFNQMLYDVGKKVEEAKKAAAAEDEKKEEEKNAEEEEEAAEGRGGGGDEGESSA